MTVLRMLRTRRRAAAPAGRRAPRRPAPPSASQAAAGPLHLLLLLLLPFAMPLLPQAGAVAAGDAAFLAAGGVSLHTAPPLLPTQVGL